MRAQMRGQFITFKLRGSARRIGIRSGLGFRRADSWRAKKCLVSNHDMYMGMKMGDFKGLLVLMMSEFSDEGDFQPHGNNHQ